MHACTIVDVPLVGFDGMCMLRLLWILIAWIGYIVHCMAWLVLKQRRWNCGFTWFYRRWPYCGKRRSDLDPEGKHRWWNLGSTSRYRIRICWVVLWVTCIIVHVMYVCWCVWLCANIVVVWIMVMCQGCEYSDNRFTWLTCWKWIPWVRMLQVIKWTWSLCIALFIAISFT